MYIVDMERKELGDPFIVVDLMDFGAKTRGDIISRFIVLEDVINIFLSFELTNTTSNLMLESLFTTNRMTFDSKRGLFMDLVNERHAYFAEKHKGTKNKPGLNTQLQRLSQERNVFAHNSLDTGDSAVAAFYKNRDLTFGKYHGDPNPKIYSEKDISDLMYRLTTIINLINGLNVYL